MTRKLTRKTHALGVVFLFIASSLLLVSRPSLNQAGAAGLSVPGKPQPLISYGKLSSTFESNQGQTDPRVKFISRGNGYTLFLAAEEAVLTLRRPSGTSNRPTAPTLAPEGEGAVALHMKLCDANSQASIRGIEEMPGKANYFIGNDPKQWRTNVPTYAKVEYQNVYPGIDLVYHGDHRQLEYDFVVSPGAEPERIGLEFKGVEKVEVEPGGDLILHLEAGVIRQPRPVVYQEVQGVRREVGGNYVLKGMGRIGFRLEAYDRAQPLVIDPTLVYSTYLGGSSSGRSGNGIAVDSAGNAYVTGFTQSTDFPTTFGALQTSYRGSGDAFVSKLNAAGSALVYSTYLGGSGTDYGFGIAVDKVGNAYVIGQTESTDFPVTSGAFQTKLGGSVDAFVSKLNAAGSALEYSTYLDGSDYAFGAGIAVDTAGNAYVTGATHSTDFPVTPGAIQATYGGGLWDVFVSKLNADGSALVYSTYLGGDGGSQAAFGDVGWAIAVDATGNAYVTGDGPPNFPTTAGAFQTSCHSGVLNAFVSKLNPAGSALIYSTYLGGSQWDWGDAIAVDAAGNAFVGGNANSADFPVTSGTSQTSYSGGEDGFITKLNATGSGLQYSTYLGGSGYEVIQGIVLDTAGNAYLTGVTYSADFPTTSNAFQTTYSGGGDAYLSVLNPLGSALVYSTYLGGSGFDWSYGIALDPAGNAYVAGVTSSHDFPTTPGAFRTSSGGEETFVSKFALAFDTTPPKITLSATPKVLWPPNGRMVPVTIFGTITDTGSGVNASSAAYAVQDEYGEVQPTGAITLGPGGSYSFTVLLQASRLGIDLDGRRYTVTVSASDNAGNAGSESGAVIVPHDQRH